LLGATFYGGLELLQNPQISMAGTGVALILLLLFSPGGLITAAYAVRDAILRQIARRHRITVPSLEGARWSGGRLERVTLPQLRRSRAGFVPIRYRLAEGWKKLALRQQP